MPIQRDLYSPDTDTDYSFFSKLNDANPQQSHHQQQKLTLYNRSNNQQQNQQQQQQASSEIENINEIRKLIREQTLLKSNVKLRAHNITNSDSSDELEVPIRRFTPLPDIPRSDEPYFRTESRLIKTEIKHDNITFSKQNTSFGFDNNGTTNSSLIDQLNKSSTKSSFFDNLNTQSLNEFSSKYNRKETRYHFASTITSTTTTTTTMTTTNKKLNNRLPALEKIITHTIQNTMDLDEDLPMMNVNEPIQNQRGIYTSPGDRIISPIKRPQAPSPLSSSLAYRRKANQKSDSDSDSDQTLN